MTCPTDLRVRASAAAVLLGVIVAVGPGGVTAQSPSPSDWTSHNYDLANRRYAPLSEINTETVGRLRLAWTFPTRGMNISQVTPLVVNGVMYTTAGINRDVVALDAATGQLLWHWRPTG